jgi:hypothetical protein
VHEVRGPELINVERGGEIGRQDAIAGRVR